MRLLLLCASSRGLLFLRKLRAICPEDSITVVSFREDPWEPPFLESIAAEARAGGCEFIEARDAGGEAMREFWSRTRVDILIAANWRFIIPAEVFRRAGMALALHDSLLPAYRGFAPVSWAIINGEERTGATLFHLAEEMDAGDIIDQAEVPIGPEETIAEVSERVTAAYLDLLERWIGPIRAGTAPRKPQDPSLATYCCKRTPADGLIRWETPAAEVHRLVRAVGRPLPGAFTTLEGRKLLVWKASRLEGPPWVGRVPGAVARVLPGSGVWVLAGDGPLLLEEVELEGERPVEASRLLGSVRIRLGS